jgi:hypothetical protein
MRLNGHELETRYIGMIRKLSVYKNSPKWLDFIWKKNYKRLLKERLAKLEDSRKNGLIEKRAYSIWKSMIEEVL